MIEVITSICGGKDKLNTPEVKGNSTFTAYIDGEEKSDVWNIKKAFDGFKDPRRNSRIHKILIHKYSNAEYTIWTDGNIKLLISPEDIINKYMNGYDMAIFEHPSRDCIYDEALKCCQLKLDDIELLIEQAKYYEDNHFPKKRGLCEGGIIIRKNNNKTKNFNEYWWSDYCRFSRRDQISLMPALDKSGLNVNIIPEPFRLYPNGRWIRDGIAEIVEHKHFEGNFNSPENMLSS